MLYLLDANILIDPKRDYYPIERVPEFWNWLIYRGNQQKIKIPLEIYEELQNKVDKTGRKDSLTEWIEQNEVDRALLLNENANQNFVSTIITKGYSPHLTDDEIKKVGRDPFLISYGLTDTINRTIVTNEVSRTNAEGANRKIPNVCKDFNIRCINTFQLYEN